MVKAKYRFCRTITPTDIAEALGLSSANVMVLVEGDDIEVETSQLTQKQEQDLKNYMKSRGLKEKAS